LTADEVKDFIKPDEETHDIVHDWLRDIGIPTSTLDYSPAKDFIKLTLSVTIVEHMLGTTYHIYQHTDGTQLVRTPEFSLPAHLHEHITTIQPTNAFHLPRTEKRAMKTRNISHGKKSRNAQQSSSAGTGFSAKDICDTNHITPECLRILYGTIDYVPKSVDKNSISITNFGGQTNNRSDVSLFLRKYRPEANAASDFNLDLIAGAEFNASNTAYGEGNLDVETVLGIAWPTNLTAYTTGAHPTVNTTSSDGMLTWLDYMLNLSDAEIPYVISTSYGFPEHTSPVSLLKSMCNGYAQLGARGVSVIFASGDGGAGCLTDNAEGEDSTAFMPFFPASCPYVTAVGATMRIPEVAARDGGYSSGGGFSNIFPRPRYQDGVVDVYAASLPPAISGFYNSSGRGYPDVSAQGFHIAVVRNGSEIIVDGTSASAPTFAAIVGLVNDVLISKGRSTMGWLNPWLYGGGHETFTDVIEGASLGCTAEEAFPARKGWDAVTGWGTPSFLRMLEVLG
jgi:tripeptidyl-peptidase-1